jgi:hypothetical protein
MRTRVGLWIDHRKAIILAVTDKRGRDRTDNIEVRNIVPAFW